VQKARADKMRRFADLGVYVEGFLDDIEEVKRLIDMMRKLGFDCIALSVTNPKFLHDLDRISKRLDSGEVNVVTRLTIVESDPERVKALLRKYRGHVDVIGVKCLSNAVARLAARDGRVDLVSFNLVKEPTFDEVEANLIKEQGNAFLELPIWELFEQIGKEHMLSGLVLEWIQLAREYEVPIVTTSSSRSLYDVRAPRELASLAMFFGLSSEEALDSISKNPLSIVERSRVKRSPSFVMPGVLISGRGEPYEEDKVEVHGIRDYKPRRT